MQDRDYKHQNYYRHPKNFGAYQKIAQIISQHIRGFARGRKGASGRESPVSLRMGGRVREYQVGTTATIMFMPIYFSHAPKKSPKIKKSIFEVLE